MLIEEGRGQTLPQLAVGRVCRRIRSRITSQIRLRNRSRELCLLWRRRIRLILLRVSRSTIGTAYLESRPAYGRSRFSLASTSSGRPGRAHAPWRRLRGPRQVRAHLTISEGGCACIAGVLSSAMSIARHWSKPLPIGHLAWWRGSGVFCYFNGRDARSCETRQSDIILPTACLTS